MEEINMRVLENCEPKQVFYYFEEICKIPHGSRNTKQDFAVFKMPIFICNGNIC
jgi:hypothetical protein